MSGHAPRRLPAPRAAGAFTHASLALLLVLISLSVPTPPAWAITVTPTSVAAGGGLTIDGSGFNAGAQALIWGSGPTIIGHIATPARAYDLALATVGATTYAYVADGTGGLQVVDVTDPTNPSITGSYLTTGLATAVTVSGQQVFVAEGSAGLDVIDVANPAAPTLVRHLDLATAVNNVTVNGNYAYVAVDGDAGLQVVNLTTFGVTPIATLAGAQGVTLSGTLAYVAEGLAGLQVFDVSSPGAPAALGAVHTPDFARQVAVSGGYAYVADRTSGLQVLDVSSPAAPVIVGAAPTPGQAQGVSVVGGIAYVADSAGGLEVFDINNPLKPRLNVRMAMPWLAEAVTVVANTAYMAVGDSGLQFVDVSAAGAASPMVLGTAETPGNALGVAAAGGYAYVADQAGGLQVVDVTAPTAPVIAGHVATPDLATGVTVVGGYAYVADRYRGLQVIDIGSPTAPRLVGAADTPGLASRVDIVEDGSGQCQLVNGKCYAYVADMQGGLQIVDISRPDAPVVVASVATPRPARGVRVIRVGSTATYRAFVVAGINGLQVIEVDFSGPVIEAAIISQQQLPNSDAAPVPGTASDIAIDRDGNGNCVLVSSVCYAYVADGNFGLEVFDVTGDLAADPVASDGSDDDTLAPDTGVIPSPLSTVATPSAATAVAKAGAFVYVTYVNGVAVFSLVDPAAPVMAEQLDTPDYAQDIGVAGDKLYVADAKAGVVVIPAAAYSPTTVISTTQLSVTADTYLPVGTFDVTVVNPGVAAPYPVAHNVLTLTSSTAVAGITATVSPAGISSDPQPNATAQSSGGGTPLAGQGPQTGGGSQVATQFQPATAASTGGGGGGAVDPFFILVLLAGGLARRLMGAMVYNTRKSTPP